MGIKSWMSFKKCKETKVWSLSQRLRGHRRSSFRNKKKYKKTCEYKNKKNKLGMDIKINKNSRKIL